MPDNALLSVAKAGAGAVRSTGPNRARRNKGPLLYRPASAIANIDGAAKGAQQAASAAGNEIVGSRMLIGGMMKRSRGFLYHHVSNTYRRSRK